MHVGKLHDVNVLDILLPEPGAFDVMDRGYVDFERFFTPLRGGMSWIPGLSPKPSWGLP